MKSQELLIFLSLLFLPFFGETQTYFQGGFSDVNASFEGQGKTFNGNKVFLTKEESDEGNTFFVYLVNNKGSLEGSIALAKPKDWFPVDFVVVEDKLSLFFNQINREARTTSSGAIILDFNEESEIDEFNFDNPQIGDWAGNDVKGASLESFPKALESFRDPMTHVPFELKYYLSHSPSGNNHLLYRFDYSKFHLEAKLIWLGPKLEVLSEKVMRIDEARVNTGIYINDQAEIFVLNTDALGLMELVRFDSSLQDFDFLQVPPGHAMRDDFILHFQNDKIVFVASRVDYEGEFEGIFYAKFNFNDRDVERIHFYQVNDEIKEKVDSINEVDYGRGLEWDDFHLVLLKSFNEEELLLGIEEVMIESSGKKYFPWQIDAPRPYAAQKSVIKDGMLGLFSFNIYDEIRWSFWIPKQGKEAIEKFAYLPNFNTDFAGGDRIDFYVRDQEKGSLIKKVNFDYYYALEPSEKGVEVEDLNSSYYPGLLFPEEDGGVIVPFETKNGKAGVEVLKP